MRAWDWLVPGLLMVGWAIFCRIGRDFPLWAAMMLGVGGVLMILASVVVHFFRKWTLVDTPANPERPGRSGQVW